MARLKDSVQTLPRVTATNAKHLAQLNISTVEDLLLHFPVRYDDFSQEKKIQDLQEGDCITLRVKIKSLNQYTRYTYRRRLIITDATFQDDTGSIRCTWFNQRYIARTLEAVKKADAEIFVAGTVQDKMGAYFAAPTIELPRQVQIHTKRLVPIYTQTRHISSRWLRYIIHQTLQNITIRETLPPVITDQQNFIKKSLAVRTMHFPKTEKEHEQARNRLDFEKILILVLAQLRAKQHNQEQSTVAIPYHKKTTQSFIESLPFELTASQNKALNDILKDVQKTSPMNRLLEGDVGSGKTIVALIVALNVIQAELKVVCMAPTEILAQQHYNTIAKTLQNQEVTIALLTRTIKGDYENADIIVGTHALIQKHITLTNIGLMIIDEQHRFGVSQRSQLLQNAQSTPHLLSMTATPIPRTLALTVYGDLDISLLQSPPKDRKPIQTHLIETMHDTLARTIMDKELQQGHQIFIIFPLIETSTKMNLKAAEAEYASIQRDVFPQYSVGLLHGRMKQKEKEEIMQRFARNETQVLVTTSVIEVGIDIPNATVMVIEDAHRFGLAQLHQFRGRVGRSTHQSYCFLVSQNTTERLGAFIQTSDGFSLAKKDLDIRGAGQLYGVQQHGIDPETTRFLKNPDLIERARKQGESLLPNLAKYPSLKKRVQDQQRILHPE